MSTDKKQLEAKQHLQAARVVATRTWPYFTRALRACTIQISPGVPTVAIDPGMRVYANPEWVLQVSVQELAAVWAHEIGHPLRRHHMRAARAGVTTNSLALIWNLAGDCELNDGLTEGTLLKLPEGCISPETFGFDQGLLAEEYYAQLLEKLERGGDGGDGLGGASVECGSGAHGQQRPWEHGPSASTPQGSDGIPGLTEAEVNSLARQVAREIADHAKSRGNVPGSWARWADGQIAKPEIRWERRIAALMRACLRRTSGQVDYSYSKPSRRQSALKNVALPSLFRPMPEVSAVIDTSGSMSEGDLRRAVSETVGLCKAAGAKLTLFSVDARASEPRHVASVRDIRLVGGGGTDMRVGIEAALKQKVKPNLIAVFTDGDTPWPSQAYWGPGTVVMAVIIAEGQPFCGFPPSHIPYIHLRPA